MLLLVLAMADRVSGAVQPPTQAGAVQPPAQVAPMAAPMPPAAAPIPSPAAPAGSASPATASVTPVVPAADGSPMAPVATATSPAAGADMAPAALASQPRDPWVKPNRAIFSFDVALERGLLAPVAHGYNHVVPKAVRHHVTSALFNIEEPLTATNDLLQLRIGAMSKTIFRFVVNSTVGLAGLFDVAKSAGVPIHFSLFGQTLGRYGVKAGPYVMLPLLGPSNVRDGFGQLIDGLIDPVQFLVGGLTSPEGLSLFVLEGVDWRARSDATMKAVYSATDPYAFVRSAYSQSSEAAVAEATGKAVALPDFDAAPGTP